MAEQGREIKKILSSKITLFLLLLCFIWLGLSVADVYYKKYKIAKEVNDLKDQIAKTEKSNQQISAMIDYLSSQSFLEKEAREKLNMKKPGEEVVIIEPSKEVSTSASSFLGGGNPENQTSSPVSASISESNFVKWWKYFFK